MTSIFSVVMDDEDDANELNLLYSSRSIELFKTTGS